MVNGYHLRSSTLRTESESRWEDSAKKIRRITKGTDKVSVKLLVDLPDYKYPQNLACPEGCYKPVARGRKDGRCDECLEDKNVLPVNYRRKPAPKDEEED